MNVRPLLGANKQPPELIQPSERPFHHSSPSTESTAVFGVGSIRRVFAPKTKHLQYGLRQWQRVVPAFGLLQFFNSPSTNANSE